MGRFYQGQYQVQNPSKYVGDLKKCTFRSSWERVLMKRFDHSEQIIQWGSEPFAVEYINKLDNRFHRYYPDFIVKMRGPEGISTIVIEVKPKAETLPPVKKKGKKKARLLQEQRTFITNMSKWEAATRFCKKRGWKFTIMTEQEIFKKYRL